MLVVAVLQSILVESLSLSLLFEPVMLHGDRSAMIMTTGTHFQPPESFNFQTLDEWPRWRKRFKQFRIASGLGTKSKEQQINTLLYCLGEESDNVLTSTGITDDERKNYKDILGKFDSFFKDRRNIIFEHVLFNKQRKKLQSNTSRHCTTLPAIVTMATCRKK